MMVISLHALMFDHTYNLLSYIVYEKIRCTWRSYNAIFTD